MTKHAVSSWTTRRKHISQWRSLQTQIGFSETWLWSEIGKSINLYVPSWWYRYTCAPSCCWQRSRVRTSTSIGSLVCRRRDRDRGYTFERLTRGTRGKLLEESCTYLRVQRQITSFTFITKYTSRWIRSIGWCTVSDITRWTIKGLQNMF